MSEKALEISKTVLEKSGKIALLLVKTGAKWGAELAAKGAGLAQKGLQSRPAQKLRPAVRIVLCVSATIAVISGIWYFLSRERDY